MNRVPPVIIGILSTFLISSRPEASKPWCQGRQDQRLVGVSWRGWFCSQRPAHPDGADRAVALNVTLPTEGKQKEKNNGADREERGCKNWDTATYTTADKRRTDGAHIQNSTN
ncbi:hypothetical protein EV126DRAFT_15847 [Verticillium dahliae]|nr:hypothetical protein EV126DRAFT_15847 [Verticillium dahliae]